jgi:hypothetical protein
MSAAGGAAVVKNLRRPDWVENAFAMGWTRDLVGGA